MATIGQSIETSRDDDGKINQKTTLIERIAILFEGLTVILCRISVGALCLDLIISVISRYVFKNPITFADELALFLFAWATFLGASLSVRRNEMVSVTFFTDRLGRYHWVAQVFSQVLILLFSVLILVYSYIWVVSPEAINNKSSALQIPMFIPYLVVPLSMLITIVFSVDNVRKIATKEK